jgi:hypothetical protein
MPLTLGPVGGAARITALYQILNFQVVPGEGRKEIDPSRRWSVPRVRNVPLNSIAYFSHCPTGQESSPAGRPRVDERPRAAIPTRARAFPLGREPSLYGGGSRMGEGRKGDHMQEQQAARPRLAEFVSRCAVIDEIIDEAIDRLKGASKEEKMAAIKYLVTRWELTTAEMANVIHVLVAEWEFADANLRTRFEVAGHEADIYKVKLGRMGAL